MMNELLLLATNGLGKLLKTSTRTEKSSRENSTWFEGSRDLGYYCNYPPLEEMRMLSFLLVHLLREVYLVENRCKHVYADGFERLEEKCLECENYVKIKW